MYRIVSHETSGLTKITSAEPLKSSGTFITSAFGDNVNYSSSNTIGTFLNGEYLDKYIGNDYRNMIEENTTWYLGMVGSENSYKLAKYIDINMSDTTSSTAESTVGLLRLGELMASQFNTYSNNTFYWLLTPENTGLWHIKNYGSAHHLSLQTLSSIKPALFLKSGVIITGGDGTKTNPFTLQLNN